jgi:hypothetical protein
MLKKVRMEREIVSKWVDEYGDDFIPGHSYY